MAEDKLIFQMIAWKAFAGYKLPHTSLRGVDVLFLGGGGGLWPLTYFLTFDFEAIID